MSKALILDFGGGVTRQKRRSIAPDTRERTPQMTIPVM